MEESQHQEIGHYRLDEGLGRGGMGKVYKAWDRRLERWVAVKHLYGGGGSAHLWREARAAAGLGHPAIVQVLDVVEDDGGDWIVMELVDGPTLAELLRDGPLDVGLAIDYGRQVAAGLAAAHAAGIVHRDLKTENVMVLPSGHLKILDFGLARRLDGEASFSTESRLAGTPRAMSPEQAQGLAVDARSDLFSLGVLLYELVTARSPFRGHRLADTLCRVMMHRQPPAKRLNPRLPQALSALVDQLLEKDPTQRPESAGAVAEALIPIAAESALYRGLDPKSSATDLAEVETVEPSAAEEVAVIRTLLVSDLINSTELVEVVGDRAAAALFRRHHRRVRDLLAEHDGCEIDKTDGFLLLFERPWNAVGYALAYHRAVHRLADEAGVAIASRVGIHLGEVILHRNPRRDVERGAKPLEVEGLPKPAAARLMSLAGAGQTLLTRAAYDVARRGAVGEQAGELEWLRHGHYRFQGIDEDVEIFEVGVSGVAPMAPPEGSEKTWRVASADRANRESERSVPEGDQPAGPVVLRRWPPPQLPAQPYPVLLPYTHPALLAGREQELAELRLRLRMPVPILGLCAPSGVGKSSLLLGGLLPLLRAEGRPVALTRHPQEAGAVTRLLGDLLKGGKSPLTPLFQRGEPEASASRMGKGEPEVADGDWQGFVERLGEVERLAGEAPILVLDQLEEVLHSDAAPARAVLGALLAATARRRPGIEGPLCRWLLAYRQDYHGEVLVWLRDVLAEARATGESRVVGVEALPYDLSGPERFHGFPLPPLATPRPGGDALEDAARVFRAAIETPLEVTTAAGAPRYPWRFAPGHAERLARGFAETRLAREDAPLTPELQVVLAHLLTRSDPNGLIEVPDDLGSLIEEALEDHLQRALESAFPTGLGAVPRRGAGEPDPRTARARALLALRELATAAGRRDEGLRAEDLARAIGDGGEQVLEQLATPLTRLVVPWDSPNGRRYVLSHDRMAEVVVHMVEGYGGKLVVDAELLALRRFVALKTALHRSEEEQAHTSAPRRERGGTKLRRRHFRRIVANAEALLWDDERRDWWAACRKRRRADQLQTTIFSTAVLLLLALVAAGAWSWARHRATGRALREQVLQGEPEAALQAFARIAAASEDRDSGELLALLRQREQPMDVLERGLGALSGAERSAVILWAVAAALPWVEETPEDPVLIANLVWALDYGPARDPPFAQQAHALRGRVLEPLRRLRLPPAVPGLGDPDWIEVPAGTFQMGTGVGEEGEDDECPEREVSVSAFRMLRHEVTNADYRLLVPGHEGEAELPAAHVSWYEATTYAAWLGGRLPTEAEWELAARAGCPYTYCTRDGRQATVDEVAWTVRNATDRETGNPSPRPIMRLEPNPWGLYDMLGNLWEWTADWYAEYPADAQRDPWGPTASGGGRRVTRGGSFGVQADWARVANRFRLAPGVGSVLRGFRVWLPARPEPSALDRLSTLDLGSKTRRPRARLSASGEIAPRLAATTHSAGSQALPPRAMRRFVSVAVGPAGSTASSVGCSSYQSAVSSATLP